MRKKKALTAVPKGWQRNDKGTFSVLNLTTEGSLVPESAIAEWTDLQCAQA